MDVERRKAARDARLARLYDVVKEFFTTL